jgi:hypothetical protein
MSRLSTADFVSAGDRIEERREERENGPQPAISQQPQPDDAGPLLPQEFVQDLRGRWDRIQTGFVDEPRAAVQKADELVATAMKRLAESFAEQRGGLEKQWGRGDDVSTEDLRIALQKYRAFFQRLLAI